MNELCYIVMVICDLSSN